MVTIHSLNPKDEYERFCITCDEGSFYISFCGNFDLYIYPMKEKVKYEQSVRLEYKYTIDLSNEYIYNLFDDVFESVKNKTPYKNNLYEIGNDDEIYNDRLLARPLFNNDRVEWYSDDYDYEDASIFIMEKKNNNIIITLRENNKEEYFPTASVRFRNSGSSYHPYNVTFMNMYHKLKQCNFDYHQITINEYLYNKKLVKKLTK